MKKTLVTADLHLSDNERDRHRHHFVANELPTLIAETRADHLLVLGDLTEEKDRHSAKLVNEVVSLLTMLGKICPVTVLMGNHDYLDRSHPFFRFLRRIRSINWVDKPTIMDDAIYLPHTDDWERDWKGLDLRGKRVYTHNTFDGADLGHGSKGHGIPLEIVKDSQVFSGDVHIPQVLGGRVTYVGAPYRVDFGDDYEPRVMLIDDFINGKVKSIPVSGVQKHLIEGTWPESFARMMHNGIDKGDILKVRVRLRPEQVAQWNEILDGVRSWGQKHGYHIYAVHPVAPSVSGAVGRRIPTQKSDEQLVKAYGKHRNLDEATLITGQWLMKRTKVKT